MLVAEDIRSLYYLPATLLDCLDDYPCAVLFKNQQNLRIRREYSLLIFRNDQNFVHSKDGDALGLILIPVPVVISGMSVEEETVTTKFIVFELIADYEMATVGDIDNSFPLP